ncbi:MAG: hypothetical protein M0R80_14930 [Proteobacteria bacterium]|jgi:hypothetical protein|nr:hypothetical protein [Pseudomonadota bacterium]
MRKPMNAASLALAACVAAACGGAELRAEAPAEDPKADSEKAIAIVRSSFDAMGGIERLRLAGAKVRISAVASADGREIPVEISLGGPARFRLDYVADEISYAYIDGACRKTVYGVSARCTPEEAMWVEPVRIFVGLTFPAADASQLGASFRTREDAAVDGRSCAVVEVRPKNTNLRLRAAYDKATGLLAQVSFDLKDAAGAKTQWELSYGDWREVKKMLAPHVRGVTHAGREIWRETARSVDFDAFDARAFDPPLPPTTDEPLPAQLPTRHLVRTTVAGQAVEIPAPPPTIGGAWIPAGQVTESPAAAIMRIVHRGPVAKAPTLFERLKGGASMAGRQLAGEPGVILLESPGTPEEPALMIIYAALAPQEVKVDVTE